jgi:hypothetical protein
MLRAREQRYDGDQDDRGHEEEHPPLGHPEMAERRRPGSVSRRRRSSVIVRHAFSGRGHPSPAILGRSLYCVVQSGRVFTPEVGRGGGACARRRAVQRLRARVGCRVGGQAACFTCVARTSPVCRTEGNQLLSRAKPIPRKPHDVLDRLRSAVIEFVIPGFGSNLHRLQTLCRLKLPECVLDRR